MNHRLHRQMTMDPPMGMMHDYFVSSTEVTILFHGWVTKTLTEYVISCLAVAIYCIFHEVISHFRTLLSAPAAAAAGQKAFIRQYRTLLQVVVHVVTLVNMWLIMLVVMTYNVGLFVSVIAGTTVGHFLVKSREGRQLLPLNAIVGNSMSELQADLLERDPHNCH
mmetsp:Transcript_2400/g.5708  ORF Transcript_2400/g.5708 Transcript_2400/m.5708 type:complete len:165 (+) Transcript_2400:6-500(+)